MLLVSMTAGAIVLMALSGKPPTAGPFSLSTYIGLGNLDPIEKVLRSHVRQDSQRWDSIEVYYSGGQSEYIEKLFCKSGLSGDEGLNCHFVVANGRGGINGQILPTRRWQEQLSAAPDRNRWGGNKTIRICVVADGKSERATEYQVLRVEALIGKLYERFAISPRSIHCPENWQ